MSTNREEELLVAERAAEWLERLKSGEPQERAAFVHWLKESRRNVREMLLATAWDRVLGQLDPDRQIDIDELMNRASANVVAVRHVSRVADVPRWTLWPSAFRASWAFGIAATAVLTVVVLAWTGVVPDFLHPNQYGTAVGEQRAIELDDGSVIHLNTQSSVRVSYSAQARDVYLNAGQAIFKVKHDATRPFRVHAGSAVVQAIGTQFDVYRLGDRTHVAVIEGVVQVTSDTAGGLNASLTQLSEHTRIAAGKAVSIIADGEITAPAAVDVVEINAWQQRRLIFRKNTLAQIAAEFNRYNKAPQIRVEGETLQGKLFSGVFDADDPESLLMYLATDRHLEFDRHGDEFVIRLRQIAEAAS